MVKTDPVETDIRQVQGDPLQDSSVAQAARLVRGGGLVAFPTETVYGLGADASSAQAVESIYRVKGRPAENPLIVHFADRHHLRQAMHCRDSRIKILGDAFWPGPLTLVLPVGAAELPAVRRGRSTVAVRIPDHPVALALIRLADRPLAAPSANLSGRPSPTSARHVLEDLGGRIPLILDAGPCRIGIESTVLDLSSDAPRILRPGGVSSSSLEEALGQEVQAAGGEGSGASPGTRHAHYRPRASLYLLDSDVSVERLEDLLASASTRRIGYLGHREDLLEDERIAVRRRRDSARDWARHLYADLRALDDSGCDIILADRPAGDGLWEALRDRIDRAASYRL